ncbi:hypothetical protein DFP72DRAFT_866316 [Ephemerocybe angulata]|uniref:Uncharacterized protein n=1 Tax=Ephemerocybe angulata TaxID=980116 RepID=A0A8H6IKS6_9AGAR|nr:hypothetical protein DFP72DRAFT_866316 [Tulosesus angulatus]
MEHNKLAYDDAFWEATLGHNYTKKHSTSSSPSCATSIGPSPQISHPFVHALAASSETTRLTKTRNIASCQPSSSSFGTKSLARMLARILSACLNPMHDELTGGLTQDSFEDLVTPGMLIEVYQTHAPFTWGLLQTFAASPNLYRKAKAAKAKRQLVEETEEPDEGFDDGEDLEEDPDVNTVEAVMDSGGGGCAMGVGSLPDGFSRNPVNVSMATWCRWAWSPSVWPGGG